jgi:endonuclease/exonuclease/phosphatase family metal-dependent hydrolase
LLHPEIGELVIYGCVLPWGGSSWRGRPSAGGAAFSAAVGAYRKDWNRLRLAFPKSTLVVAGDFNQSLVDWHYYGSKRQRQILEAALAEVGLTAATAEDGDPIARDSAPCACIDHICISASNDIHIKNRIRWPESAKPNKKLSDHFGVAVEVSVR